METTISTAKPETSEIIERKSIYLIDSLFEARKADDNLWIWRSLRNFLDQCEVLDKEKSTKDFKEGLFIVNTIVLDNLFTEENFGNISFHIVDEYNTSIIGISKLIECMNVINTSQGKTYWFDEEINYDTLLFDLQTILNTLKWMQKFSKK